MRPSQTIRSRPLLGTFVDIQVCDDQMPEHLLSELAELAFGRIARVQALMNFHDPSSELSRLNACGHLHPLPINEWTRQVIAEAVRIGKASEGVFDITVSPTPVRAGSAPAHTARIADEDEHFSFRDILLHEDGRVSFKRPLQLDLGTVARGYAIDKAAEILTDAGVKSAVINAGGDIRFIGERPGIVSLRDPAGRSERMLVTPVTAPAVSTSPAYFANRLLHWRKTSHIMHPHTKKRMCSNVSVSVFAQTCVQADALAKVVLLDEPQSWQSLLVRENASAVFVTSKGEMVTFPAAA